MRQGCTVSSLELDPAWEFFADTVMGGLSTGQLSQESIAGRSATRLTGEVSLENNGGFVQMAFDINPDGSDFDGSTYHGIQVDVLGNDNVYDLRLRTSNLTRPWQSYRTSFNGTSDWSTVKLAFTDFIPHKTDVPFDARHLRRIGVLGIGRVFDADVAISSVRFLATID
jgi:hypothetical protein